MMFSLRARAVRYVFLATFATAVIFAPTAFAAQPVGGLQAVPLTDDYGGGASPEAAPGAPVTEDPAVPGTVPQPGTAPSGPVLTQSRPGSGNDATVLAYLIELARKQGKPCPSGSTPPVPPPLTFFEPLCRAAESMSQGVDAPSAFAAQGVPVAKWRTFSAPDYPAQSVATALRQSHCEALLEPFTHIGVAHTAKGWSVVMAELTEKPADGAVSAVPPSPVPPVDQASVQAGAQPDMRPLQQAAVSGGAGAAPVVVPSVAPVTPSSAESAGSVVPSGQAERLAGEAEVPSHLAAPAPDAPDKAAGVTGQEARKLFMLLNELRAKGGVCYGKTMPPAPPLVFQAELQAAAEADAAESLARGGVKPTPINLPLYSGTNVTRLYAVTEASPSTVLDVWMMNPANCEGVYSPIFSDVGVGVVKGHWVVILGGMGKGVDSPEPPGAAAKEGLEPPAVQGAPADR